MPSGDHLKLAGDKKALKALASNSAGNDTVLWSLKVTKINKKGKPQQRVLLITNRHVLNLMPDNYSKCNRCINVHDLHHLSIASQEQEFALHVTGEYDYRFKSPMWEQAVTALQKAFEGVRGEPLEIASVGSVSELQMQMMTKASLKGGTTWSQKEGGSGALPTPTPSQKEAAAEKPPPPAAAASSKSVAPDDDEDSEGEDDQVAELRAGRTSVAGGAFSESASFGKKKYTADDFEMLKVLGKGAFGKVMLVKAKDSGMIYAMKSLSKAVRRPWLPPQAGLWVAHSARPLAASDAPRLSPATQVLLERNEVVHTKTERKALEDTHHPFLIHLRFAFQTPTKLYLVMDYCNGGELFFHLKQAGRFEEPRARLYAAEIASALEHLHSRKIVYRDLKPENVLLDSEGHVRITDFGLAKDAMELGDKTHTFCGTPDYLAPEIIKGAGHGRGVDWWSLGTMIYEMLGGLPPFYSENFNVMYDRILRKTLEFNPDDRFGSDARDLLTGLLQKSPELRLGSSERDGAELREHAWFAPIDWAKLEARELEPSFKPNVKSATDTSNFDDEFTSQPIAESVMPETALGGKGQQYEGFTYVDKGHLG